MKPITIASINKKGGVGKSTACFNLGGYFATSGCATLIIEMDPQGTISQGFFGSQAAEEITAAKTVAGLFDDDVFVGNARDLVVPTAFDQLSVVRANDWLNTHNRPDPAREGLKQFVLSEFINEVGNDFDMILVDCPPNLYTCSWNALLAADFVMIPVPPEDPATQGLKSIHEAVEAGRVLNPRLQLLGEVVIRRDSRLFIHRKFEQSLRELYGTRVFETVIPEAAAIKMAYARGQPITYSEPHSEAGKAVVCLGDEIMERIEEGLEKREAV